MSAIEAALPETEPFAEARQYWQKKLAGGPSPVSPRPDHSRPEGRWERDATVELQIAGQTFEQLSRLTGGEPFLEHAALAAALTACLFRHTQASPITVGCGALQPARAAEEPSNTLALLNEVDGEMTFRQLLLAVRQTLLEAHEHQGYPFDRLLADLGLGAREDSCPLFDVALEHRSLHAAMPDVRHDITLTIERQPAGLRATAAFSRARYDFATIERFVGHLVRLLQSGLDDPGITLAGLEMLPDEERRRLLVEWNDTARDYPRESCVHELIEAQAERSPNQTALVDGALRLSYRELDERANQLAHYLQRRGVAADAPVGICLPRSAELVIAVLAVLKAGGAYVPYDPSYPTERMAAMLDEATWFAIPVSTTARWSPPASRRGNPPTSCGRSSYDCAAATLFDRHGPPAAVPTSLLVPER